MRSGGVVALLLAWSAAAAPVLTTLRVASVHACLGVAAPDLCSKRIDQQVDDGSLLSVTTTLVSPDAQGQFGIDGNAQAAYGILHTGMSSTLNTAGAVMQASSGAQAGFEDILTAGQDGQVGIDETVWHG